MEEMLSALGLHERTLLKWALKIQALGNRVLNLQVS
jgi:hypothetical protein